jgi:hypothetical protein
MKRVAIALMCLLLIAGAALPSLAQTPRGRYAGRTTQSRSYNNSRRVYYDQRNDDRSFWGEHRDKITVAGGTAVGAVIGGLVGGRTGAVIGALAGAGGSSLYTYKVRDRNDSRYYRRH